MTLYPRLPALISAARPLLYLQLCLLVFGAKAQPVPRAVVVEHFTNTLCGVCASRNPGFYANLRQQPGALHIAYHPSSPYRACVFSQQNTAENDARTNYYGVYGGTPRLVVNGAEIPATQDYASAALFGPFQGQTTPLAVSVALRPAGPDSITATIRIATRAAHSYSGLNLYVALVEDTVGYAAPNGEQRHFDVFRRSFTGNSPLAFTPGAGAGSEVLIERTVYKNPAWASRRLYAIALVQDASRALVQAGASARFRAVVTAAAGRADLPDFQVYPNPASDEVWLGADFQNCRLELYNLLGKQLPAPQGKVGTLQLGHLAPGHYLLRATAPDGRRYHTRLVKQ
ncbi:hypothetical protein GCM10023185_22160 [Hymenobacter saemangeumensis]|uniref:T9SS type A sorting domain-containing protein n=1 Tax=Hymenobacter saemangeumensis TaxID=1084522 RepID=A0ABP8IF32_9BACT